MVDGYTLTASPNRSLVGLGSTRSSKLPWFVGNEGIAAYCNPTRYVVLDFETNNHDRGSALNYKNSIVLACWYVVEGSSVTKKYKFADEFDLHELEQDILASDFIVAHNAKFELQWMKRMGMELRDIHVFDTYLAEWVIGGNRYRMNHLGLEVVADRYKIGHKEHVVSKLIKSGIDPSDIPASWLLEYCFLDVELCFRLYPMQLAKLREDRLLHLALVRNLTCTCLADIEFNGCELDGAAVNEEYSKAVQEYQDISSQLAEIVGTANLNSGKQKAVLLYEKLGFIPPTNPRTKKPYATPGGLLSTDADTMGKLVAKTDEQALFLKLYKRQNKLQALLSKNLEFFSGVVEEHDARFFGVLNQGTAQTHRLSSSGRARKFKRWKMPKGAQLQNLPRAMKKVFTAHEEDWLVGEGDGAQIEFRVAADQGHDPIATREIETGEDIHTHTANVLLDAKEPEFVEALPKERRQLAKPHTFAPLYGSSGKTTATKAYAQFFRGKYKGIFQMQTDWTIAVANEGKLRTPYGMIFYWPGTKISRSGYVDNTTSIFNFPINI